MKTNQWTNQWTWIIPLSLIFLLVFSPCHADSPSSEIKTIIVGNYSPYTFVNAAGQPDGFSVDLIRAVSRVMGLKLEISVAPWDKAMEALKTGSIDVLPMMAYSKSRELEFDFSPPHTIAYDAIFVRKGTTLEHLSDLQGKELIVMNNDAAHDYIRSLPWSKEEDLLKIDSLPDALRTLASGRGDAAIMPKLVGTIVMRTLHLSNLELSPVVIDSYRRPFSFAVKKGNIELLERLTQGMNILRETGEYQNIYHKWFGAYEDTKGLTKKEIIILLGVLAFLLCLSAAVMIWNRLLRRQVDERTHDILRGADAVFKSHVENLALLEASRGVLENKPFVETARGIFDSCKALIGATAGYVALLSDSGEENEVLFLDAGGRACSVDPSLPMPVRGLRAEAYLTGKTVYDNDFMHSKWLEFMPGGHVALDNVMFAPLVIDGVTCGIMGLANKPAPFTDEDALLCTGFGELAALALKNSRTNSKLHATIAEVKNAELQFRSLYELSQMQYMGKDAVSEFVLDRIVEITDSSIGFVGFLNEDESIFVIHSWSKSAMRECQVINRAIHYPIAQAGIWGDAVRLRKPIVMNDYATTDSFIKHLPEGHVLLTRILSIPVFDGDRIVAIAAVGNKHDPYNEHDVRQIQLMCAGMWNILKSQEARQEIEAAAERLKLLWELNQQRDITEDELTSQALEACVALTQSEVGYLHFFDDRTNGIQLHAWSRKTLENCAAVKTEHYPLDSAGIWADSVRLGKPVVHNDFLSMETRKGYPEGHFPVIRHMSVPVIDQGRVVAIAGVGNKSDKYFPGDVTQLQLFMNNFWIIIKNKRAEEKILHSLKEKEVLLKEVHHRVKNNMAVISSLLSLQAGRIEEEKYSAMFEESQNRIRSMALVHEKLYQSTDVTRIDVRDYVTTLSQNIRVMFGANVNVHSEIFVDDLFLDIDVLVPCGLIINEILTNIYKYAFTHSDSPLINLVMKKSDEELIQLIISDNGAGFPEGFHFSQSKGLGLKLVQILVKQINGSLTVESGQGVRFEIKFPAQISRAAHLKAHRTS